MEWLLKNIPVIVVRSFTTHENAKACSLHYILLGREHVILAYIRHYETRRA